MDNQNIQTKIQQLIDNNEMLSYKKMCEYLGEPYYQSTNSKKAHLKQWSKLFEFEKIGNKYKPIRLKTEIEIAEKELDTTYNELIEIFICSYFCELQINRLVTTIPKLVETCNLWNSNYRYGINNKYELLELIAKDELIPLHDEHISLNDVDSFFNKTEPNYKAKVRNALKSLEDKSIIQYRKHLCLAFKDGIYTMTRRANNDEISLLLTIEHNNLKQLPYRVNNDGEYVEANKSNLAYGEYLSFYRKTTKEFIKAFNDNKLENKKNSINDNNKNTIKLPQKETCVYYYYEYDINISQEAVSDNLVRQLNLVEKILNNKVICGLQHYKQSLIQWFIDTNTNVDLKKLLINNRNRNL